MRLPKGQFEIVASSAAPIKRGNTAGVGVVPLAFLLLYCAMWSGGNVSQKHVCPGLSSQFVTRIRQSSGLHL